jgi:hypothetical protein
MFQMFLYRTQNKKDDILILGKLENPINDKILSCLLNNITYTVLGQL